MNHDENNSARLTLGQHIEPEDLLLYVLETGTPEERAAISEHIDSGCMQCQQELAAVRDDIGMYALALVESAGSVQAPEHSRERLMAEVGHADATNRSTSEGAAVSPAGQAASAMPPALKLVESGRAEALPTQKSSTRGTSPAVAWIGWAVAAGMVFAATHYYQQREAMRSTLAAQAGQIAQLAADEARARQVVDALTDRSAQRVTLSLTKAPGPPQPSGRATYLASKGTLIFLASHLDPLPAGKTYELWVIPASGAAPIPAGTFHPDERGNASVVTAKLEGAGTAKALGVTIEAAGGSSTPTMPILLAGS